MNVWRCVYLKSEGQYKFRLFLKTFINHFIFMANSCNHFRALLKKNWILFKRSPCGSCCEILTPIVFVFFLLAVRSLVSKDAVAETSYYGQNQGAYFTKDLNISNQTYANYNSSNATVQSKLLDQVFSQTHLKFFFIFLNPHF